MNPIMEVEPNKKNLHLITKKQFESENKDTGVVYALITKEVDNLDTKPL